jgi:transaldolase / glucose-6-phosphate isomerase
VVPAAHLGGLEDRVAPRLRSLADGEIVSRIWARDHTVWRADPAEISNRLGWLDAPERSREAILDLERFAAEAAGEGLTHVVLLGMGGSSLAAEVLGRTFGTRGGLRLAVLDSTHPDAIGMLERAVPLDRSLFLVSSKSGTTIETRSHMAYFLDLIGDPRRFVAITDPGSPLEEAATASGFRAVFRAQDDVGGRYSALTAFGLVPAALMGVPLGALLEGALAAQGECRLEDPARNSGAWLGAVLGEAVLAGRDKVTMAEVRPTLDPEVLPAPRAFGSLEPLGAWAEQLFAESTGKDGTGIIPVDGEPLGPPESFGDDRLFLTLSAPPLGLEPWVALPYQEPEELGRAFFTLEYATAIAGHVLGIQPFDQPNVQEAKDRTAEVLERGAVPDERPGDLDALLTQARPGDYVAIQAFVAPEDALMGRLRAARFRIRDHVRVATTLGLGPRFLHSTGQLHKGGPDSGVFVQVVQEPSSDRRIPGERFTFGELIAAQAAGDLAALRARGRRASRVRLDDLLGWSA